MTLSFKSYNDPRAVGTRLLDQDLRQDRTRDLQLKATESGNAIPPDHLLPLSLTQSYSVHVTIPLTPNTPTHKQDHQNTVLELIFCSTAQHTLQ
jgi:hypothetical protein